MSNFPSEKYRSSTSKNTLGARYRVALSKRPFMLFGLPFIATMVAGSFFLTPATAVRYEKHDRRVQQMTKDEELGIGKDRRRVDMNEEYYVSLGYSPVFEYVGEWRLGWLMVDGNVQRLAAKDIENWEQKRVKRLPGEHDGVL